MLTLKYRTEEQKITSVRYKFKLTRRRNRTAASHTGQHPSDNARGRLAESSVGVVGIGPSQMVLSPEADVIKFVWAVYLDESRAKGSGL